jgi:hypothetical protein
MTRAGGHPPERATDAALIRPTLILAGRHGAEAGRASINYLTAPWRLQIPALFASTSSQQTS